MPMPAIVRLDQLADQLPVAGIDVVGPLDARVDAERRERVDQSQGNRLRKQKLLAHGQEARFEYEREGEVLPFGAGPRMAALTAPGGLPLGPHDVAVAVLRIAGLVVGRGGLPDMTDHTRYAETPNSRSASFSDVFLSVDSLRRPMIRAHETLYSPAGNCLRYDPGTTTERAGTYPL